MSTRCTHLSATPRRRSARGTDYPKTARPRAWFAIAGMVLLCTGASAGAEDSVRPGVNRNYLRAEVDVGEWVQRFEGESREVFRLRREIVSALALEPGMAVADIGAGTGLFVPLLAEAVGTEGQVYALDIAPAFVAHLRARVDAAGLTQVEVKRSAADSIRLAPGTIDVAFMCDVYHHVEFPQTLLASIRRALRPGGRLVVVDFARIPGQTRAWVMAHVRAGEEVVRGEITAAGFVARQAPQIALRENYLIEFSVP